MDKLTPEEAYKAMYSFLDDYWEITKSDALGSLLGSMSLLNDGKPADSAIWDEWMEAIQKSQSNQVDAKLTLGKK